MSQIDQNCRYTKEHEWARKSNEPGVYVIGISDFAQASLGDITFVELPNIGDQVNAHHTIGSVESVKAVSDLYAPLTGEITKVNEALDDEPALLNESPFEKAWLFEIKVNEENEFEALMSPQQYEQHTQES